MRARYRIIAALLSIGIVGVVLIAGCSGPEEKVPGPQTQDGKPVPPEAATAPAAGGFSDGPKPKKGGAPPGPR